MIIFTTNNVGIKLISDTTLEEFIDIISQSEMYTYDTNNIVESVRQQLIKSDHIIDNRPFDELSRIIHEKYNLYCIFKLPSNLERYIGDDRMYGVVISALNGYKFRLESRSKTFGSKKGGRILPGTGRVIDFDF